MKKQIGIVEHVNIGNFSISLIGIGISIISVRGIGIAPFSGPSCYSQPAIVHCNTSDFRRHIIPHNRILSHQLDLFGHPLIIRNSVITQWTDHTGHAFKQMINNNLDTSPSADDWLQFMTSNPTQYLPGTRASNATQHLPSTRANNAILTYIPHSACRKYAALGSLSISGLKENDKYQ